MRDLAENGEGHRVRRVLAVGYNYYIEFMIYHYVIKTTNYTNILRRKNNANHFLAREFHFRYPAKAMTT